MKPVSIMALSGVSLAILTGGALAQANPPATAQSTPPSATGRQAVSNQPIMIGADSGERTTTGFSIRGRAEITQGANRMRADAIVGTSVDGGGVSTVTATGGVYYVTPNESIRGDRAVYTVSNSTVVMTGDVILTQGRNVLTGSRLTYNIDTGAATMAGGNGNGRIQGVFYPQGNGG